MTTRSRPRYVNECFFGRREESASRCSRWPSLQPEMAILDETDSGLDIDALRIVAEA